MPARGNAAAGAYISDIDEGHGDDAELCLLLVEDDPISREMLTRRLAGRFRRLLVAVDGAEGLRLFRERAPDLVLTDHFMPGLSGVEMARRIRALDQESPIVLMTSAIDNQTLLEAINLGVNKLIPKPFDFEVLIRLVDDLTRDLIARRELGECRLQELDLLRSRDRYNSVQQETARRKERHVVRHDLRHRLIPGADGARWGVTVAHAPRDIMCGDGHSIRELFDGRQLVFVVDAMGSGLSASLSALLTTSFCNYQVDHLHQWQNFNLQLFLTRFQEYLSGILLEEEAISCGFLLVDLRARQLETAMFGLPPLLIRGLDGSVRSVRGANPPLCIFGDQVNFTTLDLTDVAGVLVMTDGVTDATLADGGCYRERLARDFRSSPTLSSLQQLFRRHTLAEEMDDLTWLHLQRLDPPADWRWHNEPAVRMDALLAAAGELLLALAAEVALRSRERDEIEAVLGEALADAFERRCLGVDRVEKARPRRSGGHSGLAGIADAPLALFATLWRGAGRPLLAIEIVNSGAGVPADELRGIHEGHGLGSIDGLYDHVFTEEGAGRLLFLKTLEGESGHAT